MAYKGRVLRLDTVIEQKSSGLDRFLVGKSSALDFAEPTPKLERHDDRHIRVKILALSSSQGKRLGIGKSTFHYLRKRVKRGLPIEVYGRTREKLAIDLEQV